MLTRVVIFCLAVLATGPVLANVSCMPENACMADGTCDSGLSEGPFLLVRQDAVTHLFAVEDTTSPAPADPNAIAIEEAGPPEPEVIFDTAVTSDTGTHVLSVTDPRSGSIAVLSLYPDGVFILSMHGAMFGAGFGLVSRGACKGSF